MLAIYRQYQFPCKEKQMTLLWCDKSSVLFCFFYMKSILYLRKVNLNIFWFFFTCFFGLEVGVNNYFHHLASVTLHSGLFCDCPLLFNQQNWFIYRGINRKWEGTPWLVAMISKAVWLYWAERERESTRKTEPSRFFLHRMLLLEFSLLWIIKATSFWQFKNYSL